MVIANTCRRGRKLITVLSALVLGILTHSEQLLPNALLRIMLTSDSAAHAMTASLTKKLAENDSQP